MTKAHREWSLSPEISSKSMCEAILAALDAHAAAKAPKGTVPVRIAVAFDDENRPHIERVIDGDFHGDEAAWVTLATWRDALRRSSIITADVPLPVVPEVRGRVEKRLSPREWPCTCGAKTMCNGSDCGSHYALVDAAP